MNGREFLLASAVAGTAGIGFSSSGLPSSVAEEAASPAPALEVPALGLPLRLHFSVDAPVTEWRPIQRQVDSSIFGGGPFRVNVRPRPLAADVMAEEVEIQREDGGSFHINSARLTLAISMAGIYHTYAFPSMIGQSYQPDIKAFDAWSSPVGGVPLSFLMGMNGHNVLTVGLVDQITITRLKGRFYGGESVDETTAADYQRLGVANNNYYLSFDQLVSVEEPLQTAGYSLVLFVSRQRVAWEKVFTQYASWVDEQHQFQNYELTAFVILESAPLTAQNVQGTHYLVADGHGIGYMFTKEQQAEYDSLLPGEMNKTEETVLCIRVVAVNTASVPRYAFFRNVAPNLGKAGYGGKAPWSFDSAKGFGLYRSDRVFSVSKLNGQPLANEEVAIKLQPGETATLEINLPHRPVPTERAARLASLNFDDRLTQARRYWQAKLDSAAQIDLPEQRITEMIRAGLLHLDLITYGREPEGTLVPTIGVYTAIGSESSPIIQFMDSMGWHDEARRALTYFLDKQHPDGFMQNFGGYMLETGAALWSMGEHYRYTRDDEWARQIEPKLLKACDYMLQWRQLNMRDDLRGKGYGLMEGKVADPEDPYHSFMLNGYAYLGMSRVAEMLHNVDRAAARKWQGEAEAFKADIRKAFAESMGKSPVIPLGDGTWCPTAPPWVEYRGPLSLFTEGGKWFTHGSVVSRDSLLGPLYLVFQEVLDPKEPATDFLLSFHSELMTQRNVAFAQPYYSRHPVIHLRRGEVKPFLKDYYNAVASLADRQTYTFWEHFFHASPHKTHEEAWFLMQTRWMLYMERGETLQLLPGVPRAYFEDGKHIDIHGAASYFGPVSLRTESKLRDGLIEATLDCPLDRGLKRVELRLPHPEGRKPTSVAGGKYNPDRETVTIEPFTGHAEVVLRFGEKD